MFCFCKMMACISDGRREIGIPSPRSGNSRVISRDALREITERGLKMLWLIRNKRRLDTEKKGGNLN